MEKPKTTLITSPASVTGVVVRFAIRKDIEVPQSQELVRELSSALKVETVSITPDIGNGAARAYAQYGKGTGHGAKLNLGDVFS